MNNDEFDFGHNVPRYQIDGEGDILLPTSITFSEKSAIGVKRLSEGAFLPRKEHPDDACYDLRLPTDVHIHKGRNLIPLDIAIELPVGYYAEIRSRSGFAAKGMEDKDGVRRDADAMHGIVDAGYRGSIGVIIYSREDSFELARGTRISQMLIGNYADVCLVEVVELTASARGEGGFGSTGVR